MTIPVAKLAIPRSLCFSAANHDIQIKSFSNRCKYLQTNCTDGFYIDVLLNFICRVAVCCRRSPGKILHSSECNSGLSSQQEKGKISAVIRNCLIAKLLGNIKKRSKKLIERCKNSSFGENSHWEGELSWSAWVAGNGLETRLAGLLAFVLSAQTEPSLIQGTVHQLLALRSPAAVPPPGAAMAALLEISELPSRSRYCGTTVEQGNQTRLSK